MYNHNIHHEEQMVKSCIKTYRKSTKHRGFTLLEIIAVISLLIVLASITVPSYINIVENQKKRADLATALQLAQMAKTYYIEKKDTDQGKLKEYIIKNYEEFPKSKYNGEEFDISFDTNNKVNVSVTKDGEKIEFVIAGKENEELE
ncbi:prepilin-type cleavage/methylation N-terminal domain protein [[Eubacterium] yurii subsp. margaretiae ATCC 43715]|nr:prepilin-type cleavage/methylation N-terminal domain protein [[Eubacterium] yurii subsp. margaretiae ATCC 43715]